ncbi:DUF1223 domain-containing protein [Flavobacterium muglaense]|uniref:DUF1223 domain-containing protein n=1 Tax=Flavobacterium muglaense TaxID=2764716 RepID=A0A923N0Y5_9FLAO|nr:DUF1223 domain-containing protein [Flavobacterium muglaense]MBC5838858.1 DUF1223 domain-containing protein [Flavobacterium muglaense]MBC5845361.1 DUF1223 domain-containing protein [Flavobacterium muglaense]
MEDSFLKTVLYTGLIILTLGISSFTLKKVIENKESKTATEGFAVLELFTSQGCSSCPPADSVLAKYATQNNPNIIPLAFHVDYWNRLGWNDPFSKSEFTARQSNYVSQLNAQGNYTPQIVINGKYELVGSKETAIESIVNKELALKNTFHINIEKSSINENTLNIEYETGATAASIITNLALVKKKEFTNIKRGENSGLKQTSYNIVYDFKTIKSHSNTINKTSFEFNTNKIPSDFMVVAYLQNSTTGAIIGATKSEIK